MNYLKSVFLFSSFLKGLKKYNSNFLILPFRKHYNFFTSRSFNPGNLKAFVKTRLSILFFFSVTEVH